MNWLRQILGRPPLDENLKARLRAWRQGPSLSLDTPFDQASFVLVDVESTGLDPSRDSLLAIGALPVDGLRVLAGEGFEKILWGRNRGRATPSSSTASRPRPSLLANRSSRC